MASICPSASVYRTFGFFSRFSSASSENFPATASPMSPNSSTRWTDSACFFALSVALFVLVPTMLRSVFAALAGPAPAATTANPERLAPAMNSRLEMSPRDII